MNPLLHSELSHLSSAELDRRAARHHVLPHKPRRRQRTSLVRMQLRRARPLHA